MDNQLFSDEWYCVLSFLSTKELFSCCALVCKEWNDLIREKVPLHLIFEGGRKWSQFALQCKDLHPERIQKLVIKAGSIATMRHDHKEIALMTNLKTLRIGYMSREMDENLIGGLKSLTHLDLSNSGITDAGVSRLSGLINLTHLDLTFNRLGTNPMRHLCKLDRLKVLRIGGRENTESNLEFQGGEEGGAAGAMISLTSLEIYGAFIKDEIALYISRSSRLENLKLRSCEMSQKGFECLSSLINLKSLGWFDNEVKDNPSPHFHNLPKLTHLDLSSGSLSVMKHEFGELEDLRHLVRERIRIGFCDPRILCGLDSPTHLVISNVLINGSSLKILSMLKNLQRLDMIDLAIEKGEESFEFAELTHLRVIDSVDVDSLTHCLKSMPKLIRIDLSGCIFGGTLASDRGVDKNFLGDLGLLIMEGYLESLQILNMDGCLFNGDELLQFIDKSRRILIIPEKCDKDQRMSEER